jgi:hypothetical protein
MSTTAESLLPTLLSLSEEDRLMLADRLQKSVFDRAPNDEPENADDLSDEMKTTLDRRWEEIITGKVQTRDAFEVLAELRAKYNA